MTRTQVISAALEFNARFDAMADEPCDAWEEHAQVISEYCEGLGNEDERDIFRDYCVMPEV